MSTGVSPQPLETRCSVAVFRGDEVLLVRSDENGCAVWKLPGGHTRADEGLVACAQRELREETGLEAGALHCGFLVDTLDRSTGRYMTEIVAYPRTGSKGSRSAVRTAACPSSSRCVTCPLFGSSRPSPRICCTCADSTCATSPTAAPSPGTCTAKRSTRSRGNDPGREPQRSGPRAEQGQRPRP
ncbi:NUDIX hydrolase [Streptacidiphilus sp. 4-A2]|nr:NUDIX hydrolase [Streptacidiphilus sp. 4-A2]